VVFEETGNDMPFHAQAEPILGKLCINDVEVVAGSARCQQKRILVE
jgi:hypothetical protein